MNWDSTHMDATTQEECSNTQEDEDIEKECDAGMQ